MSSVDLEEYSSRNYQDLSMNKQVQFIEFGSTHTEVPYQFQFSSIACYVGYYNTPMWHFGPFGLYDIFAPSDSGAGTVFYLGFRLGKIP